MPTVLELQEQKGKLVHEAQSIIDKADTEKRALTTDEDTKVDTIFKDVETLNKNLKRQLVLEEESRGLAEKEFEQNGGKQTDKEKLEKRYETAFDSYLRRGFSDLTAEEKSAIMERRAQSTTAAEGGYTIPRGFSGELEKAMKTYGPILEVGRTITTSTGNTIDWPNVDDTSNKGRRVAENASHKTGQTDITFGTKAIKVFTYTSGIFTVSNELLQDSDFPLGAEIIDLASERLGRILNEEMTTGGGSTLPQGIVTGAANSGITAAANAITFDNMIDLYHSVNSSYRNLPNTGFMFNDKTAAVLRKIKDGENRYIWQMGDVRAGIPDTILGKPYYINDDMVDIGTSTKAVIFGGLKKYLIRRAQNFIVRRLDELYAESNATGFVVLCRYDGQLLQSAAVKYLANAAS